ncbi:murein biosynthesis integral membrane protein MurJ [uncultured Ilyobacter sp.]|uniref:murein biosynthesis integral membrane protein MurJ n=1 Tax=uncultured Ilyobacter sp. TaxID=544433 RepID=UPI0029F52AF6|nr:murein biosynthesis integral membrane protein MurJ [uncultured Ilyobacter sp.]
MPKERPVISSAKSVAICTFVSRITGMLRDMLIVQAFGAGLVLDSFFYAFQIPHLFRRLFGEGALAAAFVPTFTGALETEGRPAAEKLLARTLALLTVTLAVIVVLLEAILVTFWAFSSDNPDRQLMLALTALMLPFMLTICIVALFSSILNCLHSFVPAALIPTVLNVVMIIGVVRVGPLMSSQPEVQVFGLAISVLVAGVIQLLMLLYVLRRMGISLGWSFQPRDEKVRRMIQLMLPVMLGQGVLLLSVFLDTQICAFLAPGVNAFGADFPYPLDVGALSTLTVAQRLYQFPLGVLGVSLAIAAFPTFSRLAAREDWQQWSHEVAGSLRLAVFAGFLTGGVMIVLAEPIVQLLFEYRNFSATDTARSARVLMFYGFGMWAFCAWHIVLRGFYSLGDVRTPVKISCTMVPINLALSLVLIWFEGIREAAFAISTVTTSTLSVLVGLLWLRKRAEHAIVTSRTIRAGIVMLGITLVTAAATYWAHASWYAPLASIVPNQVLLRGIDTFGALALGCVHSSSALPPHSNCPKPACY